MRTVCHAVWQGGSPIQLGPVQRIKKSSFLRQVGLQARTQGRGLRIRQWMR